MPSWWNEDTPVLEAGTERCEGSSPSGGTNKKITEMEKLMKNKEGEFLYLFDLIKNDKVIGSNTVWSKNLIHARSSAKKRFGDIDRDSFKRLTKTEYANMLEEEKSKKLAKKIKW